MIGGFETEIAVATLTQVTAASGNPLAPVTANPRSSDEAESLTIAHLHQSFVMPVFQFFNGSAINRSGLSTNGGQVQMERRQTESDVLRQIWLCLKRYWND
jgi:hypothetical protein